VLITFVCEIHADYFHDWSTTLYLYESTPGLVILLLNMLLFAESWRSMRETYRLETSEEMRVFYMLITCASTLYFMTLPVICLLAAGLNPWVRAYYVALAEIFARLIATVIMALCLRPSRLDAMVNARLDDGIDTVGEERDSEEDDFDAPYRGEAEKEAGNGYANDSSYDRSPLLRTEHEVAPAE